MSATGAHIRAKGRPERESFPLGGTARSAKGVLSSAAIRACRWGAWTAIALLAACAEVPVAPPASSAPPAQSEPIARSIAKHRSLAEKQQRAGDLADAAAHWQIVVLLAPEDETSRRELANVRTAIAQGVREQLQAGTAAQRAGDGERAAQAMLKVLALDPANAEAAKTLREIDRQRLARAQASRAAKAQGEAMAVAKPSPSRPQAAEAGDGYDLEQGLEMFRAGDTTGGLRDLRRYVDANPQDRAGRQRIGSVVYERGRELEAQGARESALVLYEQAVALRGDAGPGWAARIQALKKELAASGSSAKKAP
jgi:tetratricopeptide (TPR) repeat protein